MTYKPAPSSEIVSGEMLRLVKQFASLRCINYIVLLYFELFKGLSHAAYTQSFTIYKPKNKILPNNIEIFLVLLKYHRK
jgi:hypothetical protein